MLPAGVTASTCCRTILTIVIAYQTLRRPKNTRVKDASQSFQTLTGVVRNNKRNKQKSPSIYHLEFFTLWWWRMEREGKREAEDRKNMAEDEAASRGMIMFPGYGKKLEDGRTDSRKQKTKALTLKSQESDGRTNGRT